MSPADRRRTVWDSSFKEQCLPVAELDPGNAGCCAQGIVRDAERCADQAHYLILHRKVEDVWLGHMLQGVLA